MKPEIAIIIPCYNSGAYLRETIASVTQYKGNKRYEIIIVNDGTTDANTLLVLDELKNEGLTVYDQENKGVGAARNAGAKLTHAPYLIFLDADNKIRDNYIDKGVELLNQNPKAGVVYGKPHFLGGSGHRLFITRPFDFRALLIGNFIDMCAVVRREAWEAIGGLDEDRVIMSHADWEFWIRMASHGWEFIYVDEITYEYRVREDSMIVNAKDEESVRYIYTRYAGLVQKNLRDLYRQSVFYENDKRAPFRTLIKNLYHQLCKKS